MTYSQAVDKVHKKKKLHKIFLQLKVFVPLFQKGAGIPKGQRPFWPPVATGGISVSEKKAQEGSRNSPGDCFCAGNPSEGFPEGVLPFVQFDFLKTFFYKLTVRRVFSRHDVQFLFVKQEIALALAAARRLLKRPGQY